MATTCQCIGQFAYLWSNKNKIPVFDLLLYLYVSNILKLHFSVFSIFLLCHKKWQDQINISFKENKVFSPIWYLGKFMWKNVILFRKEHVFDVENNSKSVIITLFIVFFFVKDIFTVLLCLQIPFCKKEIVFYWQKSMA